MYQVLDHPWCTSFLICNEFRKQVCDRLVVVRSGAIVNESRIILKNTLIAIPLKVLRSVVAGFIIIVFGVDPTRDVLLNVRGTLVVSHFL
ncbi:hypothetical protein P154DRAFT_57327 [Amniculicola lignicola CBS 123094]|uniref:Uncharacterized protein n=1 Tax=Amniculicola lignicola CBS 123094 TaxID=1392246 RepID=A0A6A5W7Y9_9PLEO|nr:hypothetical protein P154DRAFT_57327 [Amniculicola lignicola CBS 123094]